MMKPGHYMTGKTDFHRTGKLYPKIDIAYWVEAERYWHYAGTTEQWRTCRDAAKAYAEQWNLEPKIVRARKQKAK